MGRMTDVRKLRDIPRTATKDDLVVFHVDPRRVRPEELAAAMHDFLDRHEDDTPGVAICFCMPDCDGPLFEQPWACVWAREWLDAHADLMPLLVDERKLSVVKRVAMPGHGRLALVLLAGHGDCPSWTPDPYGQALLDAWDEDRTTVCS